MTTGPSVADARTKLVALLSDLDARAAGYWRVVGDRLEQIVFVGSPSLSEAVAVGFAEATRSVPLERVDLGIVKAAVLGEVEVSHASELPPDAGSGYWLRASGPTAPWPCRFAMPQEPFARWSRLPWRTNLRAIAKSPTSSSKPPWLGHLSANGVEGWEGASRPLAILLPECSSRWTRKPVAATMTWEDLLPIAARGNASDDGCRLLPDVERRPDGGTGGARGSLGTLPTGLVVRDAESEEQAYVSVVS